MTDCDATYMVEMKTDALLKEIEGRITSYIDFP